MTLKKLTTYELNYNLIPVTTLQSSCRDVILTRIQKASIDSLPLPQRLKDYLLSYYQ